MTDQLPLLSLPPQLTERQQHALEVVTRAGHGGATAAQVGAAWREQHGRPDLGFDAANGNQVLRSLRRRGLVKYRLRVGWVATGLPPSDVLPPGMSEDIGF